MDNKLDYTHIHKYTAADRSSAVTLCGHECAAPPSVSSSMRFTSLVDGIGSFSVTLYMQRDSNEYDWCEVCENVFHLQRVK